jgi:hypothetical protein
MVNGQALFSQFLTHRLSVFEVHWNNGYYYYPFRSCIKLSMINVAVCANVNMCRDHWENKVIVDISKLLRKKWPLTSNVFTFEMLDVSSFWNQLSTRIGKLLVSWTKPVLLRRSLVLRLLSRLTGSFRRTFCRGGRSWVSLPSDGRTDIPVSRWGWAGKAKIWERT